MRLSRSPRTVRQRAFALLLSSAAAFACSAPDKIDGGGGGRNALGGGGAGGTNASGGLTMGGTIVSGAASGTSGAAGAAFGAAGGGDNNGGAASMAGSHDGGASGTGSASAGSAGNDGASAVCRTVASEYASELAKQLLCNPGASRQCVNRAVAAPGCECRVFIQPSDPFAIEHLSNLASGWFDADCSMPSCPTKCTTASAGTCQPNSESLLGGRCVTD